MGNACRDCLFWSIIHGSSFGECCSVDDGNYFDDPNDDGFMICNYSDINIDAILKTGPYFSCNKFKNKEVNG